MKRIINIAGSLLGLLALIALGAGLVLLFRNNQPANTTQSGPVAQSPLATPTPQPTPTCNPPWPTPPALACPWLPSPTPLPTSSFPTPAPWTPPTSPAQTPTPLPLPQAGKNPAGRLIWRTTTKYGAGRWPASVFKAFGVDSRGQMGSTEQRLLFQNPANFRAPAGFDVSMNIDRFISSPDGSTLVGIQPSEGGDVVFVFDALTGAFTLPEGHPIAPGQFYGWHPNGYEILFRDDAAYQGLWLIDVRTNQRRLIARQTTLDFSGAAISPDGQRLVYGANTLDIHQIWTANADGSDPHLLLESNMVVYVFGWSPDGRYLAYVGEPIPPHEKGAPLSNQGSTLWVMDREGQNRKSLKGPFIFGWGFEPVWSPAGHRLAYVGADQLDSCWQKNDTYRADPLCRFKGTAIYVEDIDANELRRLATNAIDPTWSPDGSTLAFSLMDKRGQVDVWATNADGASLRQITNTVDPDQYPIWVQR